MPASRVTVRYDSPRYVTWLFPLWFFFAFFTQLKLVPGLAHNIGAFEVIGFVVAIFFVFTELRTGQTRIHQLVGTALFLTVTAAVSQMLLPSSHRLYGLLQLALLIFFTTFIFITDNLLRKYHLPVGWLLQIIIVSAAIAGILVLLQGIQTGGDIQAAGPFRNRAHMASYMLTSFWLCLIGTLWPGLKLPMRLAGTVALLLSLYCIAISGRRSVYLALFIGLAGLLSTILAAKRGKRLQWIFLAVIAVGFMVGLYSFGEESTTRAAFFRDRVGMIGGHLDSFLGMDASREASTGFFALQREGVMSAFRTSPILGIGWGGFPDSVYSPTGHEVHSTPLRFLAELGIVGLGLYLYFMRCLLWKSFRLYRSMRASPYSNAYLALNIGIWTMSLSYIYNRHITERTFWVLLAIFLAMEVFAADWHRLSERFAARAAPSPFERRLKAPVALRS